MFCPSRCAVLCCVWCPIPGACPSTPCPFSSSRESSPRSPSTVMARLLILAMSMTMSMSSHTSSSCRAHLPSTVLTSAVWPCHGCQRVSHHLPCALARPAEGSLDNQPTRPSSKISPNTIFDGRPHACVSPSAWVKQALCRPWLARVCRCPSSKVAVCVCRVPCASPSTAYMRLQLTPAACEQQVHVERSMQYAVCGMYYFPLRTHFSPLLCPASHSHSQPLMRWPPRSPGVSEMPRRSICASHFPSHSMFHDSVFLCRPPSPS